MDSFFKFTERGTNVGTEIRAGVTTFLVMVYIVALNPAIIAGPMGLDPVAVAAGTALVAGIMTLAMGLITNYPFALAAGLGLNAAVAFGLVLGLGMTAAQAMGVIVIEGLIISLLVVVGPARGDHERGAPRPEAGHRGGHRSVHPVHRLLGWRTDRGRHAGVRSAAAAARVPVPD